MVCLMLTPMISFATADTATDATDAAATTDTAATTTDVVAGATDAVETIPAKSLEELKAEALDIAIAEDMSVMEGYELVASNSQNELYLNKTNLAIIVRDIQTGAIMESVVSDAKLEELVAAGTITSADYQERVKSAIFLSVIEKTATGDNEGRIIGKTQMGTPTVTVNDSGFNAKVAFGSYGITFELNVYLDEEGLHVEVPSDSVKEEQSDTFVLGEMYLYPFLGYTELDYRQGYMIVPDGEGAIINLQNNEGKYASPYSQRIYGGDVSVDVEGVRNYYDGKLDTAEDSENVVMPVFGMVHTDTQMAMLGVIEEGEYNATIQAYPNAVTSLNWITGKFLFRAVVGEPLDKSNNGEAVATINTAQSTLNTGDIKVTYIFTSGEEADYAGLAVKYREMLTEQKILEKTESEFKVRLDFLGADKENFLVFKRNVTMTTIDNIRDILGELQDENVTNILAVYNGWQKGGVYDVPVSSYKVASNVGGNSEMNKLVDELNKNENVDFYLNADVQTLNVSTNTATFDTIKKVDKTTYEQNLMGTPVYNRFRLVFPAKSAEYLKELSGDMKEENITNIAISGISSKLFAYTQKGKEYSREVSKGYYEKALEDTRATGMTTALDAPFAYLWKYTDSYLNAPLGTSGYLFCDKEIPFLSIVLKGSIPLYSDYVNFEANKTEFFLKLVEAGVAPSFYLTEKSPSYLQNTNSNWVYSSEYDTYKETIIEYYTELKAVNDMVSGSYIMNHETIDNVNVTTYENGVKVYVNYTDEVITVDGITVPAQSYKVGEAE